MSGSVFRPGDDDRPDRMALEMVARPFFLTARMAIRRIPLHFPPARVKKAQREVPPGQERDSAHER